jgi:diadenosine tetraphosphatase ApaH/serine/threonine PP2A family protein phosphatase
MTKAIISDIHSNLEALTAVLEDIDKKGIKEIYCLGDVVGYGANPKEVIGLAKNFDLTLKGNHDCAVETGSAYGFDYDAAESVEWTKKQLSGFFQQKNMKFLRNLSEKHSENRTVFVHGSPRDPVNEYILNSKRAAEIFEGYMKDFDYCFGGHSHIPGIFHYKDREIKKIEPSENPIQLQPKMIIGVGSVGQPRDNDNRACWVSLDNNIIQYHRVGYDYKKTQDKIIKAGLPGFLATRLGEGI